VNYLKICVESREIYSNLFDAELARLYIVRKGIKMKKYKMYSDSQHSWLAVPTQDLKTLKIYNQITRFSYVSATGKTTYLECDQDFTTFFKAFERLTNGQKPVYTSKYINGSSRIRRLSHFDASKDYLTGD